MTKSELLQSYRNGGLENEFKLWDTWVALGANTITEQTRYYTEGMVYRLVLKDVPNKPNKSDYVIYCKKTHSKTGKDAYDWNLFAPMGKDQDTDYGEVTFGNNIISAEFEVLLYPSDFHEVEKYVEGEPALHDPNFIPFGDLEKKNDGHVEISEEDYERCITCLGYPFVQEDELEYTREEIIDLAIKPALERYFKYFPKTQIVTYPITGVGQDEVFPTGAYDIIHFSVQQGRTAPTGMISNPLLRYWDEAMYMGGLGAGINGTYHGMYSPKTQTNNMGSFVTGRAAQQAVVNYRTRYHLDKYQAKDGKWHLRFYSNKMGVAEVHYAMQTNSFDDVEFARRPELFKLCNAEVKKLFGNLRRQIKSDLPGVVNYGEWVAEADKDIEDVETNWKSIVKYSSVIRGSL